jgi:hypothetical protein
MTTRLVFPPKICVGGFWWLKSPSDGPALEAGRHLDRGLQAAWAREGEAAFEYVILEVLEEAMSPLVLKETLKARQAEWARLLAEAPDEAR